MLRLLFLLPPTDTAEAGDHSAFLPWLPLIEDLPGLLRLETAVVAEQPFGDTKVAAVADAFFEDDAAVNAVMASTQGKKLARAMMADPRGTPEIIVLRVLDGDIG
jgi:hypothetical protein